MRVKVSTDLVPPELQNPTNAAAINQQAMNARNALSTPGKLEAVCKHEAAHLVYFNKTGVGITILGPSIIWKDDRFSYFLGAIKIEEQNICYTPRVLTLMARGSVAGIVMINYLLDAVGNETVNALVGELLQERENVEQSDLGVFRRLCIAASFPPYNIRPEPERYWTKAKKFVTRDLRVAKTLQQIEDASKVVMAEFVESVPI
jgi:hypothetical protein